MNSNYSLESLAARAEIQDVMFRWCRGVDRCDWDMVRDVFHPDGYDNHGIFQGDVEGLIAWLSERHKTISRSMHLIGNILIEFSGDDIALVESYCLAVQRYTSEGKGTRAAVAGGASVGDEPFDMLLTGRYVDKFERRDGVWRIHRRTVVFDNSMLLPVPPGAPALGERWEVSRRDSRDPLWELRASLALLPNDSSKVTHFHTS